MTAMDDQVKKALVVLQHDPDFKKYMAYMQEHYLDMMTSAVRCNSESREYISGRAYEAGYMLELIASATNDLKVVKDDVLEAIKKRQKAFV